MQIINNLDFPVNNLREFIVQDLGPALNASDFGHVKLLTYDEILLFAPFIIRELMKKDSAIHDYVSGIAFHWYENKAVNPEVITGIHETYPEMILLSTEACEGVGPQTQHVILGSWERAENYAFDILKVS